MYLHFGQCNASKNIVCNLEIILKGDGLSTSWPFLLPVRWEAPTKTEALDNTVDQANEVLLLGMIQ